MFNEHFFKLSEATEMKKLKDAAKSDQLRKWCCYPIPSEGWCAEELRGDRQSGPNV